MLEVNYTWDEMELVKKIKFNFAPIQIYEYTKDRMMDLLDCGLYSNEEFIKMVRKDFDNPLDILDFENDYANGGSLYFYTEPTGNGYIRGFDTMEETMKDWRKTYEAEENLAHNMDLLTECACAFGEDVGAWIEKGAEYCDVSIRCYLLAECIESALDELEEEGEEE